MTGPWQAQVETAPRGLQAQPSPFSLHHFPFCAEGPLQAWGPTWKMPHSPGPSSGSGLSHWEPTFPARFCGSPCACQTWRVSRCHCPGPARRPLCSPAVLPAPAPLPLFCGFHHHRTSVCHRLSAALFTPLLLRLRLGDPPVLPFSPPPPITFFVLDFFFETQVLQRDKER